ncbi:MULTISPECIES: hypothetical protein [unclassified Streptomyces]|uniref:hypothetical protein n=1 Tax=unclassified Streptomyces TaxID=2593676 RepID=UPI002258AF83|nr:hypothetical protein [Streptomyces sp. NBC_01264]MCX4784122.1 hypothetical protein [Streptomyces sp. NBC_01264]
MPIPLLSPGDFVRITIDAEVRRHEPGELELSPRTLVSYESEDDLTVELTRDLFRQGDVAFDGRRTLLRTARHADGGGREAYWTAPDGSVVRDNEISPGSLRLLMRCPLT